MSSELAEIAEAYRHWARTEAAGSSPVYERLALAVAESPAVLTLLTSVARRQPNLLFGTLRWYGVDVRDPDAAVAWAADHPDDVRDVLRSKRTQTNEVGRCATLLPVLALLEGPIALVEVGASAGLNLLYDSWRYHYPEPDHWVGAENSPLTLTCSVTGPVPLPDAVPEIAWRAGLDLNPLDPTDPETRRWLQCLVWPEHVDRCSSLGHSARGGRTARPRAWSPAIWRPTSRPCSTRCRRD